MKTITTKGQTFRVLAKKEKSDTREQKSITEACQRISLAAMPYLRDLAK